MNFIIVNSTKYDTDSEVVSNELQQLGLPRGKHLFVIFHWFIYFYRIEHSIALCKVYSDNLSKLKTALKDQSIKCKNLKKKLYKYDFIN